MHHRCRNHPAYTKVEVDERWGTWEGFLANQPAGRPWEKGLNLCRTGDVGNYSPENTRWDTARANAEERIRVRGYVSRRDRPPPSDACAEAVVAVLSRALERPSVIHRQRGIMVDNPDEPERTTSP